MRGLFDGWHWIPLAIVVILLFGAKRLPDAARSLGRSMRILKSEVKTMHDDEVAGKADASAPRPAPDNRQIDAQPAAAQPTAAPVVDPVQRVGDK
jgi:sec-independent protein translocase protein TatA